MLNPGLAKKYLQFVKPRAKNDPIDAMGLARLAEREGQNLRPFQPLPEPIEKARDILVRRKAMMESRVALQQVKESVGDPGGQLAQAIAHLNKGIQELEKELSQVVKTQPAYADLLTIPGVGPLSAALLVCALGRGEFLTSDSLVAYAGLDPRPRDSGAHRGKRRLSHQGDAHLRTTLFMAARCGARLPTWKSYYQAQLAKGLSSTEATVILARKILRVAWSIYKHGGPFIQKNGPEGVDNLT